MSQKKNNNINLAALSINNTTDYKELTKNLQIFQQQQQKQMQKQPLKRNLNSPFGNGSNLLELKLLENTGLLKELKIDQDQDLNLDKQSLEISLEDIESAFKILDPKNNGNKITLQELKNKLPIINPHFPEAEIGTLTNGKNQIKAKELYDILKDNELYDFDPVKEAFFILDPKRTGQLDIDRLRQIFSVLGFANIDDKDRNILLQCLDIDNDDKISLEDIRQVLEMRKN